MSTPLQKHTYKSHPVLPVAPLIQRWRGGGYNHLVPLFLFVWRTRSISPQCPTNFIMRRARFLSWDKSTCYIRMSRLKASFKKRAFDKGFYNHFETTVIKRLVSTGMAPVLLVRSVRVTFHFQKGYKAYQLSIQVIVLQPSLCELKNIAFAVWMVDVCRTQTYTNVVYLISDRCKPLYMCYCMFFFCSKSQVALAQIQIASRSSNFLFPLTVTSCWTGSVWWTGGMQVEGFVL